MGLVAYNLTIGAVFDDIGPSAANDFAVFRSVDKLPCAMLLKEVVFLMHGLPPFICIRA